MSKNRFVSLDTTRIDLSDGDWIELKNEISYGERQRLNNSALDKIGASDASQGQVPSELGINFARFNLLRMYIWIADWSFCDAKGKHADLTLDTISHLSEGAAAEIETALTKHIEGLETAKKAQRATTQTSTTPTNPTT